jgi:hypothetical protein
MLSYLPIALLGISATVASPVDKRTVDNTQPAGSNPIAVASTQFLGAQASDNSCSKRDLGFAGRIAGKWYAVYGDTTLWCAAGITDPSQETSGFQWYGS